MLLLRCNLGTSTFNGGIQTTLWKKLSSQLVAILEFQFLKVIPTSYNILQPTRHPKPTSLPHVDVLVRILAVHGEDPRSCGTVGGQDEPSRSKPLFARMNSCCDKNAWYSGCTASASAYPTPAVAMSLKHLIWHLVCVNRMNFSAIGSLSLEYKHLRAYTSRQEECHNNNADDWKQPLDACKMVRHPHDNEASNNWKCASWQEAESAEETLHDPYASTEECSRTDSRHQCPGGWPPSFPPSSIFHPGFGKGSDNMKG